MERLIFKLKKWIGKHIIMTLPDDECIEFSDKYRDNI